MTKKKPCEDCGKELSMLYQVYDTKTGGYKGLCTKCARKHLKEAGHPTF